MYLHINLIKKKEYPSGDFDNIIKQIKLCKDDGTYIKFIKQTDLIMEKIKQARVEITIPEIQDLLTEKDLEKILPKTEPNLFDWIITKLT